jgi:hypothetical protein
MNDRQINAGNRGERAADFMSRTALATSEEQVSD